MHRKVKIFEYHHDKLANTSLPSFRGSLASLRETHPPTTGQGKGKKKKKQQSVTL
jgi:hypothetical protein